MITEQGHKNPLLEGQLEGKWGVLGQHVAHSTPYLYCKWDII